MLALIEHRSPNKQPKTRQNNWNQTKRPATSIIYVLQHTPPNQMGLGQEQNGEFSSIIKQFNETPIAIVVSRPLLFERAVFE